MNHNQEPLKTGEPNVDRPTLVPEETVQPLTHQEIDRRIGDVAARIVAAPVDSSSVDADNRLVGAFGVQPDDLSDLVTR